jgi:hypothetical protein
LSFTDTAAFDWLNCTTDEDGNRLIESGAAETDYAMYCIRNILGGCAADETEWSKKLGLRIDAAGFALYCPGPPGASKRP